MLIAHDADGNEVATLDYMVALQDGKVVGLIDFEAHEAAGGQHTDIWHVSAAVRSQVDHRERPRNGASTPAHLPIVGRK